MSAHEGPGAALDNERLRQFIRLIQCPTCSLPLREPFALPCGRAICRTCLPEPHERTGITYPGLDERRQGLKCPFPACGRGHAVADCSIDIALRFILDAVEAVLVGQDQSLAGTPTSPTAGPSLLAYYYALAKQGRLKYDDAAEDISSQESRVASDADLLTQLQNAIQEDVECRLCYSIMTDPLTTPCGHTFCRPCLKWALDSAKYCPACRRPLTLRVAAYSSNQVLSGLVNYFWNGAAHEDHGTNGIAAIETGVTGLGSSAGEEVGGGGGRPERSIFVGHVIFPSMKGFLFFFEPRYMIMIRRVLEGDRIFGMVGGITGGGFTSIGTLVRIDNFQFLYQGQIIVQATGISRFRVLEHSVRDGYVVAKIQPIDDISIPDEEELEAAETTTTTALTATRDGTKPEPPLSPEEINRIPTATLFQHCLDFIQQVNESNARRAKWFAPRGARSVSHREPPRDPAAFPWWFADRFPVRPEDKYELLASTSVRERLKICRRVITAWETRLWWTSFCTVM
ncbi:hypothetical protein VTK26DRAFT_3329 [Humicola hyalothermophila]